jgi:DNA-binding transcriptional regulator YiaG
MPYPPKLNACQAAHISAAFLYHWPFRSQAPVAERQACAPACKQEGEQMSLTRKDKRREATEFASWVATPTQSQPELRKRLIGDQVRQARRSAGLTQLELARTLKIALSKLSRYERGLERMPPRLLLTSIILGLATGRKALQGGLGSSQRLN